MIPQPDYLARIAEIHQALGIDPSYGSERGLAPQPEASMLVEVGPDRFGRDARLVPEAAAAWGAMRDAAASDGVVLELVSAFRSVDYQRGLIERKLASGLGIDAILQASAAPGYSEHHTGRAVDLSTPDSPVLEEAFETTAAFAWLTQHAAQYGFHLSFPRDNPHCILYEPWHWAHAGVQAENLIA